MYLYWRIQQDLNCLGEEIKFTDPVLTRALHLWVRKHFFRLILVEELIDNDSLWNYRPGDIIIC